MAKPRLTKKRSEWVKNRDAVLKGTRLAYNAGIQERYVKALEKLVVQMSAEAQRQIKALFKGETSKEFFASQEKLETQDASLASLARILMNRLTISFVSIFELKGKSLASMMVESTSKSTVTSVHESLQKLTGGLSLKTSIISEGQREVQTALVAENVDLITSIPQQYMKDVTGSVMRSITTGRGLADLVPELQKYEGISYRRAKNIALDQTRKAYASISRQKLLNNGIKQFEWVHSGGGFHPRDSHIKISGHLFNFATVKEEQEALGVPKADQGFPGEPINCKCTMRPVIIFGDEDE